MSKGKTTTVQEASLPAFQEAQMKELFDRARGLSLQPFVPYTGPMVAGFNPDQLQQFDATRGLFESSMAYDPTKALQGLAQKRTPVRGEVGTLLDAPIEQYQSPFQQQVIDQALGDIQRQADIARGGAQDRAIRAGAFGGSRSAILESESQRPFIDAQARTAANLRQAGFEQAQRAAESDIFRQQQLAMFDPQLELRARQQRMGLLGGLQGTQLQNLGLLGSIGQQQQGLGQRGIDAARGEFQRALGYGPQQLGLLQAGIGIPLTTTTTTGKQKTGLGDVLGTGAELLGTAMTAGLISDVRLKTNINYIGMSEQGHKLYTWEWNEKAKNIGIDSPTFGVLAQEVMKYKPSAVSQREDGYYIVNYKEL
jgi:hypothetical protein